jgi:hypothetical protein
MAPEGPSGDEAADEVTVLVLCFYRGWRHHDQWPSWMADAGRAVAAYVFADFAAVKDARHLPEDPTAAAATTKS